MRNSLARNQSQFGKTNSNAVEVIGEYVELRKAGRQFLGLCPFHAEKTPSFYVHPEKGFHCWGCGACGDLIRFVQDIENLTFGEAIARLGVDYKPVHRDPRKHHAATLLARWLNGNFLKVGARLRELSRDIAMATKIPDDELADSLTWEWDICSDLHEDLSNPVFAAEFWELRNSVEQITADVELEPIESFPPLTDEYRAYLRSLFA